METAGRIGICVLTYNSAWRVRDCFSQLAGILEGMDSVVVCVDNRSHDDSAAIVEAEFPWVTVIRSPVNGGYSAGNNAGARELLRRGCEFLVFLNPDVRLRPDTFVEMRSVLERFDGAGCVGCQGLRGPDRAFRRRPAWIDLAVLYGSARHMPLFNLLLAPVYRARARRHYIPPETLAAGDTIYAAAGDCIMFRARAFEEAGAFDERTFMYAEEFIMSERLRGVGYRVAAAPQARYLSDAEGSSSGVKAAFLRREGAKSIVKYARFYRGWKVRAGLLAALFRCEDLGWRAIERLRPR